MNKFSLYLLFIMQLIANLFFLFAAVIFAAIRDYRSFLLSIIFLIIFIKFSFNKDHGLKSIIEDFKLQKDMYKSIRLNDRYSLENKKITKKYEHQN